MDIIFETAIFNRKVLRDFIDELTYDQLIKIPKISTILYFGI